MITCSVYYYVDLCHIMQYKTPLNIPILPFPTHLSPPTKQTQMPLMLIVHCAICLIKLTPKTCVSDAQIRGG